MKNYTNDDIDFGPLLSGKPIERRWLAIILQKIANKKLKGEEKEKILKSEFSSDSVFTPVDSSGVSGPGKRIFSIPFSAPI